MKILGQRVLIEAVEKEVKEGFQTVDVMDSFVYKGRVVQIADNGYTFGSTGVTSADIKEGDIVLFAKGSPDTHELENEGKKFKSVLISDILAVL